MNKINIYLVILLLCSFLVFSEVCQENQPINSKCYDVVKLKSMCNYVDVYNTTGVFKYQFPLEYLYGNYFFNYSINIPDVGDYVLYFCDDQTYTYISTYNNESPYYMTLNTTFLKDNDKIKIFYYINVTNETLLTTVYTLYYPNGSIYYQDSLSPENSISSFYIYNNTALANKSVGFWKASFESVGTVNNYLDEQTFKVNSIDKTLPTCDATNISYTYYVPAYCDFGQSCYIFYNPNLPYNVSKNANGYIIINNTAYNMFYSNGQWYSILNSNQLEDVSFNLLMYYYENNKTICSSIQPGKIKFRKAYYVDVRLYTVGIFNNTQPYKNQFDYIYLTYTNKTEGLAVKTNSERVDELNTMTDWLKKYNKKQYNIQVGGSVIDSGTYFWGKYENGKAKIKLYEIGGHDIYIVNSKILLNNSYKEFQKPVKNDQMSYDSNIYKGIYLNQSDTIYYKISVFQTNGNAIISKILWTIFFVFLLCLAHGILCLIPAVGVHVSTFAGFITVPVTLILIIIKWLG